MIKLNIIIIIFLFIQDSILSNIRSLADIQTIIIKVFDSGEQEIINSEFVDDVQVYINGNEISIDSNNKILVPEGQNSIILQWDNKLTNCEKMFYGLSNIIEIDFTNFDTSEVIKMQSLFEDCINLEKIVFGNNFVTSRINSMHNMFFNCYKLTSLDLSDFDTSQVSYMENLFYNCNSLTSLNLSNFHTSLVVNMDHMFYNCSLLSYLSFSSNFNTQNVKSMASMFLNCNSLTSLNLSNFNTLSVENMVNMFYDCTSLQYLDISNFDTSKNTNMGFMFSHCQSLLSLDLSHFNTELVTDMNEMFNGCYSLTSLDVSSFNTRKVTKMNKMFKYCRSLISLDISGFDTSLVTMMESLFEDCKFLTSIDVSHFNTESCLSMANMFDDCELLSFIDVSNFNTSKVTDMKLMFNKCRQLTSLDLSNFDTSHVVSFERMFDSCTSLQSLDLSNFNTISVENMEKMFSNCLALASLDISSFITSSVESFLNMFYNCEQLAYLDLSSFSTTKITNMEKMFFHCSSLTTLDLSNFDTSLVTNMISLFEGCSDLEFLNINSFVENANLNSTNMFKDIKHNLIYCISNEDMIPSIKALVSKTGCETLDCSDNWKENYDNMLLNKKKDINVIYDKCIEMGVEEIAEDFYFSNENLGLSIYMYNMDNIEELKGQYNNLTFIEMSEDKKKELLKNFGVDENEDLFVFISDYPSNNNSKTATSNYSYIFLLGNGTSLNLSEIDGDFDIKVTVPIRDLELANYKYALEFSNEGYDIYDKDGDFYNNICSPAYIHNNDITLKDRKIEIYPNNVTLCKDNCEYKETDLDDQRMVCICQLSIGNSYEASSNDDFSKEKDHNEVFEYILDNINYKIFQCYSLILSLNNLVNNPAFYTIISIFIICVVCSIVFATIGYTTIRISMFKEIPTKLRLREHVIEFLREMKNKNNKKDEIKPTPPKRNIEFQNIENTEINKEPEYKFIQSTEKIMLSEKKNNLNHKKRNKKQNFVDNKMTTEENLNKYTITKKSGDEELIYKENLKIEEKEEKIQKNLKKKSINYNRTPFTQALREDKRNLCQVFKSLLIEKIELCNVYFGNEIYRAIILSQYLLNLLINFFFNTLFYSDEIVSQKYHNNGKLDLVVTLVLSLLSNIITSIFVHYIDNPKIIEEKLRIISEVRDEKRFLYWLNKYLKSLKQKIIIFIIIEIIIIIGSLYYITIFFIVYSKARISLLINYLVSLFEVLLKSIGISLTITLMRKLSIYYKNSYIYNASKFIDINF